MNNFIAVTSIIISVIAILVSVATSRKQNKIALFELRYKCYSQLRTILSFDSAIYKCDDSKLILTLFDMLWKSNLAEKSGDECLINSRCKMEVIVNDVFQSDFLFKRKFDVNFSDVLINVQNILMAASYGKVDTEAQEELHRQCDLLEKNDLAYMKKKLRI